MNILKSNENLYVNGMYFGVFFVKMQHIKEKYLV